MHTDTLYASIFLFFLRLILLPLLESEIFRPGSIFARA